MGVPIEDNWGYPHDLGKLHKKKLVSIRNPIDGKRFKYDTKELKPVSELSNLVLEHINTFNPYLPSSSHIWLGPRQSIVINWDQLGQLDSHPG